MTKLCEMYITLFPIIIAGILNMIWCKLPILKVLNKPIDANKKFYDEERILGDNKTWKGFWGMILLTIPFMVVLGVISKGNEYLSFHNYLYRHYENTLFYNIFMGLCLGLSYAVFELPNSFIKRRIKIEPGKKASGHTSILFVFLDQADSLFGCVLVVSFVYPMNFSFYLIYVLVGAVTHIILNILLYFLRLRKNMF